MMDILGKYKHRVDPWYTNDTHIGFIERSIEAGILLSRNGALRTIEEPSAPSG